MQVLGKSSGWALFLLGGLRHADRCPTGQYGNSTPYKLLIIKNLPSVLRYRGVIIWAITSGQSSSAIFVGGV